MVSAGSLEVPLAMQPARAGGKARPSVFLPKEHGSWSLAFEPLTLGLLVAPTAAGTALAVAAASVFFARRPSKAVLAEATRGPVGSRLAATLLTLCAATGIAEAMVLGRPALLWPLLFAAPLGGLYLFFDLQNSARAASAELAGATAFALLSAAIATLAGWSPISSLSLVAIMVARTVPTVIAVRNTVRLKKLQDVSRTAPVAAAAAAFLLLAALASLSLVPWIAAALALLLVARAVFLAAPSGMRLSARRIGTIEAALGVLYVAGTYLGYRIWHFPGAS